MALQESVAVRNACLDQIETTIGTGPLLKIFSGAVPVNCAAADPSGLLATITLPSDWMANASGGTKAKSGTWSAVASGSGTALSWRLYDSSGTVCHAQGTCGQGSGDLSLDNTNIAAGQTVTVNTFTITKGNA